MFPLAGFDVMWAVFVVAAAVLLIAALVSISRNQELSSDARAPWVIAAVLLPVLGPVAWFMARPRKRPSTENSV